jgi:hypothetical protein
MTCGLAGSLLLTVIWADLKPKLVGLKRIGAGKKLPPAMISG